MPELKKLRDALHRAMIKLEADAYREGLPPPYEATAAREALGLPPKRSLKELAKRVLDRRDGKP